MFGYINLCRIYYERMKARGSGVIVNVIGAAGERFDANYITGAAGNAALMTFTRALGGRSLDDGVRVVGINPGPVETDRIVTLMKTRAAAQFGDESRYPELMARYPLGRAASPREIADLALFLGLRPLRLHHWRRLHRRRGPQRPRLSGPAHFGLA